MYNHMFKSKGTGSFLKKTAPALLAASLLFMLAATAANGSASRQHGAHVHGVATLNVALDGNNLMLELESPAANIVGFEHTPENEQQEQAVHDAMQRLENGAKLFRLPPKAGCTLHEAQVKTDMATGHHDEDEGHDQHHEQETHDAHDDNAQTEKVHDHEQGPTHSEFEVVYHFECAQPDKLTSIEVLLFNEFSGFERIDAQILTEKGQGAAALTPESFAISL